MLVLSIRLLRLLKVCIHLCKACVRCCSFDYAYVVNICGTAVWIIDASRFLTLLLYLCLQLFATVVDFTAGSIVLMLLRLSLNNAFYTDVLMVLMKLSPVTADAVCCCCCCFYNFAAAFVVHNGCFINSVIF